MALRMVEIFHPRYAIDDVRAVLEEATTHGTWEEQVDDETILTRTLMRSGDVDDVLDRLQRRTENNEGFRIVLIPIEATLPRIEDPVPPKPDETSPTSGTDAVPARKNPKRIAKQELMADLQGGFSPDRTHIILVILSAIVAAVGLLKDNVAVLIGAMVIAPLLGPNMALSLATTLGDTTLVKRALWTNFCGFALALTLAVLLGLFLPFDGDLGEILNRTSVSHSDLILALASGAAGALAFTSGAPSGLIGVMVAVALMPPLVVAGLFLGSGQWKLAAGAFALVTANVICVNLTGVATFWLQGVRPRVWWEAERARRAFQIAVCWWSLLLALLLALLFFTAQSS